MGFKNYGDNVGRIVDQSGLADFTTIGSALNAMSAASLTGTLLIRPGTYTENVTLIPGINLAAWNTDSANGTVIINGTCTLSTAGTVDITGIELKTNSAPFLTVSGSAASAVNLYDCFLNASNNTGINFTSSSASASIAMFSCSGNVGTTGIGFFSHSSAGTMTINGCILNNSGGTTTVSTQSAGGLTIENNYLSFPISISSTATFSGLYSYFDTSNLNITPITSSVTIGLVTCDLKGGTAVPLIINTNTAYVHNCTFASSNIHLSGGTGTLAYSPIFPGDSNTLGTPNTSTNTPQIISSIYTQGLTFDNVSTMANYVSGGSFSPTITNTGTAPTVTYTDNVGVYTQIGNRVFVDVAIDLASYTAGTGNAQITLTGAPTPSATANNFAVGTMLLNSVTFDAAVLYYVGRISPGSLNLGIIGMRTAAGVTALSATGLSASSAIRASVCYHV
jgi:hypothetical protein